VRVRQLVGIRLLVSVCGLHLFMAGLSDTALYLFLRRPTELSKAMDPRLEDVVYPVAHWALTVGLVLLVSGVVLVAAGWLTSPRWHPGEPLRRKRDFERLAIATLGAAFAAGAAIALSARRSVPALWLIPVAMGVAWVFAIWLTRKQPIEDYQR